MVRAHFVTPRLQLLPMQPPSVIDQLCHVSSSTFPTKLTTGCNIIRDRVVTIAVTVSELGSAKQLSNQQESPMLSPEAHLRSTTPAVYHSMRPAQSSMLHSLACCAVNWPWALALTKYLPQLTSACVSKSVRQEPMDSMQCTV